MRILWILKRNFDLDPDVTTWIEISNNLLTLGHKTRLITSFRYKKTDFLPKEALDYVPTIKIPILCSAVFNLRVLFALPGIYKEFGPEAIIFYHDTYYVGILLALLKKLRLINTKLFLDIRTLIVPGSGLSLKIKEIYHSLNFIVALKLCDILFDGMTFITPAMERYLTFKYKLKKMTGNIWGSGVDIGLFNPDNIKSKDENISKNLNGKFVAMYHGVIYSSRSVKNIVLAMNILKNKGFTNFAALIVGVGTGLEDIARIVKEKRLEECVFLTGRVKYELIPQYIALADVGILPMSDNIVWRTSHFIKFLEYLAMGKPTINIKMEAFTDLINGHNVCFWSASNSPEDLAEAILNAYNAGKSNLLLMGKMARQIVIQYTWKAQAEKLLGFVSK